MKVSLSLIVAIAKNYGIGKQNNLLFHISEDLKRFKKLTMGHKIIMGRKTFESLPNGPLPNREHIILTRNKNYTAKGCKVVISVEQALDLCDADKENFVIGGGAIYKLLMPYVNKMYITIVDAKPDADTFFPQFQESEWHEKEMSGTKVDEKSGLNYTYMTLVR